MSGTSASPVESVDRALRILMTLGVAARGARLDELAGELGIAKSTLHRILGALKFRGFVAQPEPNGPYFLGSEMLATAFRFHETLDLRALVHPLVVSVQDQFRETVHMAVLDGAEIVYLDKIESAHAVRMTSVIGGRNAAHATGVGKALLAWTYPTNESVKAWAAQWGPLQPRTRHTTTSPARLAEQLAKVRERGYAIDVEENEVGVCCVAVPIFLGRQVPAAAVSVTWLKARLGAAGTEELGERLRGAVAAFTAAPGG